MALAGDLSASQLERVIKHYEALGGERPSQTDDDVRRTQCGVTRWVASAGLVHHEIVSAPEEAGLIDAALSFGAESLFAEARAGGGGRGAGASPAEPTAGVARVTRARRQLDSLVFVMRQG